MFGLTVDKLLLIALLAGALIGPSRLPGYTRQLTDGLRAFRRFVEASRARAEEDMGISLTRAEWEALNVRQYDPRRLVREALAEPVEAADVDNAADSGPVDDRVRQAATIRPGQRYHISGSSSHPRRVLISSLPEDDPRRIAASVPEPAAGPAVADAPEIDAVAHHRVDPA